MILKSIDILNFKNIGSATLEFSEGVNCLLGMNGMGKSNLLDAIHVLSMTRPMTGGTDGSLIKHGEEMMLVKGVFHTEAGSNDTISCGISKGKRKSLKRNGKEYGKFSEHIGNYPIVVVTPEDSRIITGGGEERRKLIDMVISQVNREYLSSLIKYGRALENRNKMLRAGVKDTILYESIEAIMIESGTFIHSKRKEWLETLAPMVEEIYGRLSGARESISLTYRSQLNGQNMQEVLKSRREKDQILGFTSGGIHRDDIEAWLDGYNLRSIGSQGQLKTFIVSLRLAIFRYLKEKKGVVPLLLLDDIFDKLDSDRVENIMKEVSAAGEFRQIFITDTNRQHLDDILAGIKGSKALINVENGEFTPIEQY